ARAAAMRFRRIQPPTRGARLARTNPAEAVLAPRTQPQSRAGTRATCLWLSKQLVISGEDQTGDRNGQTLTGSPGCRTATSRTLFCSGWPRSRNFGVGIDLSSASRQRIVASVTTKTSGVVFGGRIGSTAFGEGQVLGASSCEEGGRTVVTLGTSRLVIDPIRPIDLL